MKAQVRSRFLAAVALASGMAVLAEAASADEPNSRPDCRATLGGEDNPAAARRAIRACNLELGSGALTGHRRAELLIQRAIAYRNVRDVDSAAADLEAARSLAAADPWLARSIAAVYVRLGRLGDGERELDRAIKLEPHPVAFLARCEIRFEEKRAEEALVDCETAHTADPSSRSAELTARIYRELGRSDAAISVLEAAVESKHAATSTLRMLASLYDEAGRSADALRISPMRRRAPPPR